jgi:hypothetical protein
LLAHKLRCKTLKEIIGGGARSDRADRLVRMVVEMKKKTDDENLFKKVYTKENVSETLAEKNGWVKTPMDDTAEGVPPSDSAIKKAQEGKKVVIPDQNGRNSHLDDAEKLEYKAVHNETPTPTYRDEIYREKPVDGRVANN